MKTSSALLVSIAITFSIGSGFLSKIGATQTAWAEVLTSEADQTWECDIVGSCSSGGVRQCKIAVPIEVAPFSRIVKVSNGDCVTPLFSDSEIVYGEIQFFDVRDYSF